MAAATTETHNIEREIIAVFKGSKAKWLPLFRRLVARISRVPGIELRVIRSSIALHNSGALLPSIAVIRVVPKGLQVGFALSKAALKTQRLKIVAKKRSGISHQTLISETKEIDDEVLLWLRAAQHQARTAKRQST